MVSPLQANILDTLVSKYETRKDYGRSEKNGRRTMLHVNKKNFPDYFHVSDSSFKREFNLDAEALADQCFIKIAWERFSEKEVIEKLILLEENLLQIYELLGRTPKQVKYERIDKIVEDFIVTAPKLLLSFYSDLKSRFKEFAELPSIINIDSEIETKDALYGLHELIKNKEEIPRRNWSIKLYQDSKKWEKLQGKIIKVVRDYLLTDESDFLEDNQLLGEYGILNNPQLILMSGNIIMNKNGKTIDFSLFKPDFGVNPRFFDDCDIEIIEADAIITVENLTSYYDYLYHKAKHQVNQIVLYLGGYHNYGRRLILNKLNDFLKRNHYSVPFYHWGDIDLHGFHIWKHLRNKTGIDFRPLFMDESTYINHLSDGKPIKETDLSQIKKLLEQEEYNIFHDVIHQMLKHKRTIEQEAIYLVKN
ncbi:Wadjet anti-phage system protein JetD domain-containing protein [Desulfoscipio gibsoniae]|uniref:DNA topoisomerase VI, subunit A n=1 Tax=Desulfoscipio gibsoniae DSM 7213 TaxID=767817 RepID=R4KJ20_9FIRM|nr:Wadjet anti-phage system protein JetD domain-containing protein [Desulfoscipio gibsoniae]AGL03218.1 DNA topoisomerase VI, subunit A [Desulfoscipio gibsoniae DSM 7213]